RRRRTGRFPSTGGVMGDAPVGPVARWLRRIWVTWRTSHTGAMSAPRTMTAPRTRSMPPAVARGSLDRGAHDAGLDLQRLGERVDDEVALDRVLDAGDQPRRILERPRPRVGVRARLAPHLEAEELDAALRAIDRLAQHLGPARG